MFRRPGGPRRSDQTRSHPELGRQTLLRQWYYVLRPGRVGSCQACQAQFFLYAWHYPDITLQNFQKLLILRPKWAGSLNLRQFASWRLCDAALSLLQRSKLSCFVALLGRFLPWLGPLVFWRPFFRLMRGCLCLFTAVILVVKEFIQKPIEIFEDRLTSLELA